ncbi:hypothetical protein GQ473_06910 [archaeon]|nr:hypothetical protein [archaeon]
MSGNTSYQTISENLAKNEIDPYNYNDPDYDYYATCDRNYTTGDIEDFNCNTHYSTKFEKNITGPDRQSSMITSLWNVFQKFKGDFFKYSSIGYSDGHADNCDVWSEDYTCDDPNDNNNSDQGQMILAYWNAYSATGNNTYKQIAANLTNAGLSKNGSVMLIRGFWKAYEMTGNNTYKQKAINLTNQTKDNCITSSCESFELALNIIAYWEAYEQNPTNEYMNYAFNKTIKVESSNKCNAYGYNYSCENDLSQGAMISAYWKAYQAHRADTGNIILNITINNETNLFEEFNATIYIENNNSYKLSYIDIILTLSNGLTTDNSTLNITTLMPGNNTTYNIKIQPIGVGLNTITLSADALKGAHGQTSTNTTVFTQENIFQNSSTYLEETTAQIDEEYFLIYKINNTFNYTLMNLTINMSFDSITTVTNITIIPNTTYITKANNTTLIIPSIPPGESLTIIFTLQSSNDGITTISLNTTTPYGGFVSNDYEITITLPIETSDSKTSTSSSTITSAEIKEETYTYTNINTTNTCKKQPKICKDLEEYIYKNNLEIDIEKTKNPNNWILITRNITKNITLDISPKTNQTIIIYDIISKTITNTSKNIKITPKKYFIVDSDPIIRFISPGKKIHINYQIESKYKIENFEKPYIYFTNPKKLKFNITTIINDSINAVTNVTINITTNYFKPNCKYKIDSKNWIKYTKPKTLTDLNDGEHTLIVLCTDHNNNTVQKTIPFKISNPKKNNEITNETKKKNIILPISIAAIIFIIIAIRIINRKQKNNDPHHYKNIEKELDYVIKLLNHKKYKDADMSISKIINTYSKITLPPHHEERIANRIKETLNMIKKQINTHKNNNELKTT